MITLTSTNYTTNAVETAVYGVGTTLFTKTESERVMSDIWEYVQRTYYIAEDGRLTNVITDVSGFDRNSKVEITFDADYDAAFALYRKYRYETALDYRVEQANIQSEYPAVKGREVKVARGRNNRGVIGKVVVVKEMQYNAGYRSSIENKLAIALDDEMTVWTSPNGKQYPCHKNIVWVWARNCVVVNPQPDLVDAKAQANRDADKDLRTLQENCRRLGAYVSEAAAA